MKLRQTPRTPTRDPLLPIDAIVTVSLWFFVLVTTLFAVVGTINLATTGETRVSFAGIGDDTTCASLDRYAGETRGGNRPGTRGGQFVEGVGEGVRYEVAEWEVCLDQPSLVQAAAGNARELGGAASFLAVALLVRRLLRSTRRHGLFATSTAVTVRTLGWTLLGIALLLPVLLDLANGVVLAAAIEDRSWYADLARPDLSWTLLVTALGVITVARVLDHAVALQDEAELTV